MKIAIAPFQKKKTIDYEAFQLMNNYLQQDIQISRLSQEEQDKEATLAIIKFFYADDKRSWIECINEFLKLRSESIDYNIKMNLDFEKKPANYYITADTYLAKADLVSLYNHLSGKKVKAFSIQFATQVKNKFLESVAHLKEDYEWIYNPPTIGKIGEYSIGKQLRQEFQEYYGAYAEITYLIAITESISFDKANEKPLLEYLAVGEYLIRKRAVESVE